MRHKNADVTRRRIIVAAGVLGAVAAVVAVGALIAGTFPRPADLSASSPSTPRASATASVATPRSAKASPSTATVVAAAAPKSALVDTAAATTPKPKPKSKAAKPKPPAPVVPPLGMARVLSGSRQVIVATGPKLGATHGTLRIFNLSGGKWTQVFSATCRFGTNGLIDGTKRKEGSRTTPTGIWWPGTWVWGYHAKPPSGTLMPYRPTTAKVWWSDERNSTYNTWVVSSRHVSGEHLVDVRPQYEYALSSGYNASPNQVVRGRGTAIFLHVFDPPDFHNGLSAGCVTLSRNDMVRVFRTMDPALKPCFAVGTERSGAGSIASY